LKTLVIIFIALLIVTASAQEIEVTETVGDIEIEINENGLVNVAQDMEIEAHEAIYQDGIIVPKAKFVEISDLNGSLEYDSIIAGDEEIINFYFSKPLNAGETKNITIKYSTEFFTNKQGDTWELSFSLRVSNKSVVKIIFPENVIISFTSSEILPSTYIENGRQVLELESEGDEVDFVCEYKFTEPPEMQPNLAINETENETTQEPWMPGGQDKNDDALIILAIIITLIILAAVVYHFKKSKKSKTVKPAILGVLDENEREVVELLQSKDAEITQAYIHKTTGMPKATLSKVMRRLEERNIVERRLSGRTNWVKLKEEVFG